jgi:hydroxymethylbilane synthase
VGTSSLRRRSQLLALRPDLEVSELRGNVDTRLRKLGDNGYEAIVLALAGLRRLGREAEASAVLDAGVFVPAPGQGILALEARSDDSAVAAAVAPLCDEDALERLTAERALVVALGASCRTPVGAIADTDDGVARIAAYVGLPDGSEWIRDEVAGARADPAGLGRSLAERLLAAGAGDLLQRASSG